MSLKHSLAKGGFWLAFASALSNLSGMVVFVALARLLTPEQFGIVAFATIFIELGMIFVSAGVPDWLVQREHWEDRVASTAFWTNMAVALAIVALIGLVLVVSGSFFQDANFDYVLAALSATLLIDAASTVHVAKLRREFRFREIALRTVIANILMGAIGVTLAYLGFGVWALVTSRIFYSVINTAILWAAVRWRPSFSFSTDTVRSFASFSTHTLGSQLLNRGNGYLLGFIIGAVLGPAMLAQYRVGWRALRILQEVLIEPIQNASLTAFSRVKDEGREIGAAYLRVTRACSLILCPMLLGAAAVAVDFVEFVFGAKWHDAGLVMAALALAAGPMAIANFTPAAFSAAGKAGLNFATSLAAFIGNAVLSLLVFPWGIAAVALSQTVRAHLTLPLSLRLLWTGLGVRPSAALRSVAPSFLAASVMAIAVTAARYTVLEPYPLLLRLVIEVAGGGVVHLLALLVIDRRLIGETWHELSPMLGKRFRKAAPAVSAE